MPELFRTILWRDNLKAENVGFKFSPSADGLPYFTQHQHNHQKQTTIAHHLAMVMGSQLTARPEFDELTQRRGRGPSDRLSKIRRCYTSLGMASLATLYIIAGVDFNHCWQ